MRLPHDHRDAAGLALCHPTFIVFVVPLGETCRLTQFTTFRLIHTPNTAITTELFGERLKAGTQARLQQYQLCRDKTQSAETSTSGGKITASMT